MALNKSKPMWNIKKFIAVVVTKKSLKIVSSKDKMSLLTTKAGKGNKHTLNMGQTLRSNTLLTLSCCIAHPIFSVKTESSVVLLCPSG